MHHQFSARHRDVFPLPQVPQVPATVGATSHCSRRRLATKRHRRGAVCDVIDALNDMAACGSAATPESRATAAQKAAVESIVEQVLKSEHPPTRFSPRGAASELQASDASYTGESVTCTVRLYVRSLVSVNFVI